MFPEVCVEPGNGLRPPTRSYAFTVVWVATLAEATGSPGADGTDMAVTRMRASSPSWAELGAVTTRRTWTARPYAAR